jgi:two-component system, OmpR family, sensor histidine kinase QseC
MTVETVARRSLVQIITVRLALASLLAIILQVTIVVVRTYLIEDDLNRSYVTRQAHALLAGLRIHSDGLVLKDSRVPRLYAGKDASFYAFRILSEDGRVLAQHNGQKIAELSPWQDKASRAQDLWLLDLDADRKLYVAGGVRQKLGDQYVWIEVATFGDPASTYLGIVAAEVADDVWLPMAPLILLMLGVATLSVRRSLSSLMRASAQAETISPLDKSSRLDISDMPREAAGLVTAINGLLDRVGELVKSQRLFIARAAHELRTPLAIMMLELGRIDDTRVRRLEEDVRSMSASVDHLLALARLESTEMIEVSDLDMGLVASEVVDRFQCWAAQTQHQLVLRVCEPARFAGDGRATREALRNLVENAVRHTPPGTEVRITVGPAGSILVEDNGPGLRGDASSELVQPFRKGQESNEGAGLGLAIVRLAVDLHGGKLEIGRSSRGGAKFAVTLPDQTRAGA